MRFVILSIVNGILLQKFVKIQHCLDPLSAKTLTDMIRDVAHASAATQQTMELNQGSKKRSLPQKCVYFN